jgi:alpha-aminoadipate/glutamate carrier protein LysW
LRSGREWSCAEWKSHVMYRNATLKAPVALQNLSGSRYNPEQMATCPECDAEIEVDEYDVDKGDLLSCPECGSNLEVTGLSPIELDVAGDEDDDDDDDEDEEEKDGDEDELDIDEDEDTEEEEDWDE